MGATAVSARSLGFEAPQTTQKDTHKEEHDQMRFQLWNLVLPPFPATEFGAKLGGGKG